MKNTGENNQNFTKKSKSSKMEPNNCENEEKLLIKFNILTNKAKNDLKKQ